ncbi:MAG: TrkH family potassium uptake protein [Parachlamydiaceae bacterium]
MLFSGTILIALGFASYYQFTSDFAEHPQQHTVFDFFLTFLACGTLSGLLLAYGRNGTGSLYRKEGIICVVLIWLITPWVATIPFLTSGTLDNPLQAYFEMVSGFTTTGSTVLQAKQFNPNTGKEEQIVRVIPGEIPTKYAFYGTVDPVVDPQAGTVVKTGVEALGKALLFWRSFTQWLGGVGIVVLFVAVLPALGIGGKILFQSEAPGPVKEGVTPRIKDTAVQLWKIYLLLTVLSISSLMLVKQDLPLFEAVNITFATLATGGFSTQNASLAGYNSAPLEWVVILFMIAGSINFSLYYFLIKGKFYKLVDPEFILFLVLTAVFSFAVVYPIIGATLESLTGQPDSLFSVSEAIRAGVFQLVSAQSTTGFVTANYNIWPYSAQVVMLVAMFVGGMSGSTAGGIKVIRQYMLFKIGQNKVESIFRPDHLKVLKLSGREVDHSLMLTVLCFFLIVVAVATLGTYLYVLDGIDLETAIGLTACMMNNTGLSFRMAGPDSSCAFLSDFSLIVASAQMIAGRLEYYAVLAVLVPAFWRKE